MTTPDRLIAYAYVAVFYEMADIQLGIRRCRFSVSPQETGSIPVSEMLTIIIAVLFRDHAIMQPGFRMIFFIFESRGVILRMSPSPSSGP